jgi:signal peptidase
MRALARVTALVVLVGAAIMVASQLLGGPASYVIVSGRSMEPTLRSGDVAVLLRHASYRPGDVVAYNVPDGEAGAGSVVIHRVIGGSDRAGYLTEGDNRNGQDTWRPKPNDVIGKMALQIPSAGFVAVLRSSMGLGLGAGLFAFFLLTGGRRGRPAGRPPQSEAPDAPDDTVPAPPPARGIAAEARGGPSPPVVVAVGVAVGAVLVLALHAARSRY